MPIGIDIVHIPNFKRKLQTDGFVERVFSAHELNNTNPEHLAGVFAAKEAYFKALGIAPPQWLEIEIVYSKNGQPQFSGTHPDASKASLAISHDGEYTLAVVFIM